MNQHLLRSSLKDNIRREAIEYFGLDDPIWLEQVTSNWYNDAENYDGRWQEIDERLASAGRVLDMAAGCGTFVLHGLHNNRDVYGVEPEAWKLQYFRDKLTAEDRPATWHSRLLSARGESLPFPNAYFDLVTSYQTIEHVQDVEACLSEMLRVIKINGVLYLRAPDYNCFFEPHYRLPFLPQMNKALAAWYVRALGRPAKGLDVLQWVTERRVVAKLQSSGYRIEIKKSSQFHNELRKNKIAALLPRPIRGQHLIDALNMAWKFSKTIRAATLIGRSERVIDLWITKLS